MNDILYDQLTKELIEARNLAIEKDSNNIKLKRELFVVQEELNRKESDLKYLKNDMVELKQEIRKIQDISEEIARELSISNEEVKYWYGQNAPTLRVIVNKWKERVIKYATDHIKRFKPNLRQN